MIDEQFSNDNDMEDKTIPLFEVGSGILQKVIKFGSYYQEVEPMTAIETPLKSSNIEDLVQPWYVQFVADLPQKELFELATAANYLKMKPLIDLSALQVAMLIKVSTFL